MKVLELFSGTESFSKVARILGHETFTIDIDNNFNPNLCINIMDFDIDFLPDEFKNPDIVWASIPCQCFSVASISKNWKNGYPINEKTINALKIVQKTIHIIEELKPKFFFIENPRGMLRKQRIMQQFYRTTVCYCQYGDSRMKPTDLWNNIEFQGKMCKNGNKDHIASPRGSRTGTQGLKNDTERSIVPQRLCLEILKKCEGLNNG